MSEIDPRQLYEWCRIPAEALENHPDLRVPLRLCRDSDEMAQIMAQELAADVQAAAERGAPLRGILPCGPTAWFKPFTDLVNRERISLRHLVVFHMDEALDWQGRELPRMHPFCFRGTMEREFYGPVEAELAVPEANRVFLGPDSIEAVRARIAEAPIDVTFGHDGHIAYNQPRRHPFNRITVDDMRNSVARIQENSLDTMLAVAQRNFGTAYQFVPPMSVTLGMSECLSAKKIRIFSDTGAWKQTALRVALFSPVTAEYSVSLLQEHPDALITVTQATAAHPFSEHPEWDFGL
jgi:glucosamine-6-phosphate deaminase